MRLFTQSELKLMTDKCVQKVMAVKEGDGYSAKPFKHFLIDNFFDEELAQQCLDNFPAIDGDLWQRENDVDIEVKQRTIWKSEFDVPEGIISAVRILNSAHSCMPCRLFSRLKKSYQTPIFPAAD